MTITAMILVLGSLPLHSPPETGGTLSGTVGNTSQDNVAAGETEIVLQVFEEGKLLSVEQAVSDARGHFEFTGLPMGSRFWFLPGASCDGVYYPGPRVQITSEFPLAKVDLKVCDAIRTPSPLVLDRHDITIRQGIGMLHVTESLTVENPSDKCYIGVGRTNHERPVTLSLSVPPSFEKVTFQQEFFGRRFTLVNGQLVTDIPWPPGRRTIEFTYDQPHRRGHSTWQRKTELPCRNTRVFVETDSSENATCNLPRLPGTKGEGLLFGALETILPAGSIIHVKLDNNTASAQGSGKWLAIGILAFLVFAAIAVTAIQGRRRRDSC